MPGHGKLLLYDGSGGALGPEAPSSLGLPAGDETTVGVCLLVDDAPAVTRIVARSVSLADAVPALLALPLGGRRGLHRIPDSARAWAVVTRLSVQLVAAHAVVPTLTQVDGTVVGSWRALVDEDPEIEAALAHVAASLPVAAHALALGEDRVWDGGTLVGAYTDAVADLLVRHGGPPPRPGRPRERLLPWTARWSEALADPVDARVPLRDDAEELVASVAGWLGGGHEGEGGVVELHLAAPADAEGPWPLSFALRTDDGVLRPAADVWRADPDHAETVTRQEALLRGLGRCARVFEPMERALGQPEPESVALDVAEAWTFIVEAAPLLRGADVVVVVPDDVEEEDLRIRVRLTTPDDGAPPAAPDTVTYDWEVALGEESLEGWELDAILDAGAPLVHWRDRWVRLDPDAAGKLHQLGPGGRVSLTEALGMGLAGASVVADLAGEEAPLAREQVDVVVGGALAGMVERIREASDRPPAAAEPPGFVGVLRPYQRRGVAWLEGMSDLGLGGVLADDMGLGKTIQLIAYLLSRPRAEPALVVCPTSVVGNWQRELRRFAPGLKVIRWHGADRPDDAAVAEDVVVTTYGTLRRDVDALAARSWGVLALDEAQQIKNPQTAGARAVRRLRRAHTVALTGTPLENRLAELWALLDVTNPGLLGRRADFTRRFVKPIERHHDRRAAARLRRLVAPFVLRRTKTDPAVIADLPDKIERTVTCPLTPEQATLYQAAVDRVLGVGLEEASAMERRGRVLALLTELKQICNHPAQALGEDHPELTGRSGKLAAAREIVMEAVEGDEQVLLFTQYVAMGHLLVSQLRDDLGVDVPFLHGGLPASARERIVDRFQARIEGHDIMGEPPPVLVVSLRAGGTGLNLTAATHVLHYDRWWNPAVEDQATDRAHRIGQQRTVEVHKLVTAGTVEERIDELLAGKRALADQIVGAGEAWVTELGDDELRELLTLSADAEISELDDDLVSADLLGVGRGMA